MRVDHSSSVFDVKLDDIDLEIVRILHDDGRSSYSDISKIVGVSAGTVRNRIGRMRSAGLLYFDVWLDPYRSGLGVHATLLMKVQPRQLAEAADALADLDETAYVATLAGAYDIVADVFCRDILDLRRLIHDKVQQIEGVVDVSTNLVTENKHQAKLNTQGVLTSPKHF